MTNVIHKYRIKFDTSDYVEMPKGAQILDVQIQYETFCVWAIVDPEQEMVQRKISIIGTGQKVNGGKYIATIQNSIFVWHIFDGGEVEGG